MRGVVQIAHGMGEHIGRYADLIEALVSVGLTVYGSDHRGHDRTAPSRFSWEISGAGGFDLLVGDMVRLSRMLGVERRRRPRIPEAHITWQRRSNAQGPKSIG